MYIVCDYNSVCYCCYCVCVCRYVHSVVNSSDNSVDVYDSEGEVINFDSGKTTLDHYLMHCPLVHAVVLLAVIRFITNVLLFARQPQLFPPILPQLVCHLISLVQITTEQVCA